MPVSNDFKNFTDLLIDKIVTEKRCKITIGHEFDGIKPTGRFSVAIIGDGICGSSVKEEWETAVLYAYEDVFENGMHPRHSNNGVNTD